MIQIVPGSLNELLLGTKVLGIQVWKWHYPCYRALKHKTNPTIHQVTCSGTHMWHPQGTEPLGWQQPDPAAPSPGFLMCFRSSEIVFSDTEKPCSLTSVRRWAFLKLQPKIAAHAALHRPWFSFPEWFGFITVRPVCQDCISNLCAQHLCIEPVCVYQT